MRAGFASLTTLARKVGADEAVITELHGQFFDGSEQLQAQVKVLALLARVEAGDFQRPAALASLAQLAMVNAYQALSGLARLLGTDGAELTALHSGFYAGNEQVSGQVEALVRVAGPA